MSIVTSVPVTSRERETSFPSYSIKGSRILEEEREGIGMSLMIGLFGGWPMRLAHCIRQVCEDHAKYPRESKVQLHKVYD